MLINSSVRFHILIFKKKLGRSKYGGGPEGLSCTPPDHQGRHLRCDPHFRRHLHRLYEWSVPILCLIYDFII